MCGEVVNGPNFWECGAEAGRHLWVVRISVGSARDTRAVSWVFFKTTRKSGSFCAILCAWYLGPCFGRNGVGSCPYQLDPRARPL